MEKAQGLGSEKESTTSNIRVNNKNIAQSFRIVVSQMLDQPLRKIVVLRVNGATAVCFTMLDIEN